jgi:hypothetical protein
MAAPGTAAPPGSVTIPDKPPVGPVCENAPVASDSRQTEAQTFLNLFVVIVPILGRPREYQVSAP